MRKKLAARILIVDDDPDILLTARIVLKAVVSEIESTNDPHQITKLIEEQDFKLVLLDMNFTTGFTSG
ncbi:MAG: response regulator, partial [Bacteroidota bacterium]